MSQNLGVGGRSLVDPVLGSSERSRGLTRITHLELVECLDLDHRGKHGTAHPSPYTEQNVWEEVLKRLGTPLDGSPVAN